MPFFLIEYATSGAGLRARGEDYRAAQADRKAYRQGLSDQIVLAGPKFTDPEKDPISSIVILRAGSRDEADKIARDDPYLKLGEFSGYSLNEMNITAFSGALR